MSLPPNELTQQECRYVAALLFDTFSDTGEQLYLQAAQFLATMAITAPIKSDQVLTS